jgi:hypothetical protein
MSKHGRHTNRGSWRKERASVHIKNTPRPRSNKYRPSPSDQTIRPSVGSTSRYWRGGYTRKDGTHVKGHYVTNPNHKK